MKILFCFDFLCGASAFQLQQPVQYVTHVILETYSGTVILCLGSN